MSLIATCPSCGQNFKVGDDKAGRKFRCRECEGVVTVPQASRGDDEWGYDDFDQGGDDYSAAPPPRRERSRPAVQKKSKGPLIIGITLSVLLVAGLGIGGYFLFRGGGGVSGPRAEAISYVTDDAQFGMVVHPKQIVESPLYASLPAEFRDKITNDLKQYVGIELSQVEQVLLFGAAPAGALMNGRAAGPPRMGVVFRLNTDKDLKSMLNGLEKTGEVTVNEQTYQGKTYYEMQREDMALWQPDPKTVVVAPRDNITRIMNGNKQGRATSLGRRLLKMPLKQHIAFTLSADQLTDLKQMGTQLGRTAPAQFSAAVNAIQEFNGLSGWIDLSSSQGGRLVEITLEFGSSSSAKAVADLINQFKAAFMLSAGQALERELGPKTTADVVDAISGITAETSGNNLVLAMKNPGNLDSLVKSLGNEALKEMRPRKPSRFEDFNKGRGFNPKGGFGS